jgi:Protein of unknown function (DUF664).
MQFDIQMALPILERTPKVIESMLYGLPDEWILRNEGPDTWSAYDVVGHLIHGEKNDWVQRMQIILGEGDKHFKPFDRTAMFTESKGKTLNQLLDEFKSLRKDNLLLVQSIQFTDELLDRTGIHPKFGTVTLKQLLSTWVVHDLTHINQISRVLAKQYEDAVGPWKEFLGVLSRPS